MASSVNWESIRSDSRAILNFLTAVDKERFGTGLAYYDEAAFMIKPRSEYFNNQAYQWVVNVGNQGATFEKVQEAFLKLKSTIEALVLKITAMDSKNSKARSLFFTLVEIQKVVECVSREGLKKLSENYRANPIKTENANSLLGIGEDCFTLLKKAEVELEAQMIATDPTIAADVRLIRYAFSASKLLHRRDKYQESLRLVGCSDNGVEIPIRYIEEALFDAQHLFKHGRGAVFNAACEIKMPQMATPIPAQGGTAEWSPLRISSSLGTMSVEKGVTGVCEKSNDLPTFYYLISSFTKLLTVSCGAPDTALKLDQLVFGMQHIKTLHSDQKFTSCAVLQLNSFATEAPLIRNVQLAIPELKQRLGLTTLLHINISYRSEKEDTKARRAVNIDGLALLACSVLNEVKNLLSVPSINATSALPTSSSSSSTLIDEDGPANVQELLALFNEESSVTVQIQSLMGLLSQRWAGEFKEPERIEAGKYTDFQKKMAKILIDSTLPTLQEIIEKASSIYDKEPTCGFRKVKLLLYSLRELLSSQLGVGKTQLRSRCQTVEMFLLLFRMLKMPVILVSGDGINRGGAVRALIDAQCQLEKELYQEAISKPGAQDKKEDALMKAQSILYDLIKSFEGNRDDVLKGIERSIQKSGIPVISDLNTLSTISRQHPDLVLITGILGFADCPSSSELKRTLRYLELVGASLLGPQAEIALFGRGVIGYKFDQDAYWATQRYYANYLPLQRCPSVIRTNSGDFIKLYDYSAGGRLSPPSITLTTAGRDIILRLGQQD
ncbi:MAG TPA: hypothetical protein VFU89_04780 [Rhabdochlamydiaceae bacterium]|nr:hypothetical protein [Rhabdochlamydiaceae bacterium]